MRQPKYEKVAGIKINNSYEGVSLETKIKNIITNNEPIDATAPQIFTEKKNGVEPQYDIRSDTWEIAREKMDIVSKTQIARREGIPEKKDGKTEPIQGTESEDN